MSIKFNCILLLFIFVSASQSFTSMNQNQHEVNYIHTKTLFTKDFNFKTLPDLAAFESVEINSCFDCSGYSICRDSCNCSANCCGLTPIFMDFLKLVTRPLTERNIWCYKLNILLTIARPLYRPPIFSSLTS